MSLRHISIRPSGISSKMDSSPRSIPLAFDKAGADRPLGFISQRQERRSLVVKTNLPFARWSDVFLDATAAAGRLPPTYP